MIQLLVLWILNAVALGITGALLPGVRVRSAGTAVVSAALLGLVNAFIRPILVFFSIPLLILTVGLFTLVINALLFALVAALVEGFDVDSFGWALVGAVCYSLASWLLSSVIL